MLQWQPLAVLPLVGAVLTVANVHRAWRLRAHSAAAVFLILLSAGLIEWSVVLSIGYSFDNLSIQTGFFLARFPGISVLVVGLLWFSRTLADPRRGPSRREIILLSIVPALTTLAAATNPWHHLLLASTQMVGDPPFVATTPGPLFWVHALYNYSLLAVAWSVLIRAHRRGSLLHRRQLATAFLASLLPVAANILTLVMTARGGSPDWAVLAFAVAGLFFARAMGDGLLTLVPLARTMVMEQISDGVVVLDAHGTILDANPAAIEIARRIRPELNGGPIGAHWDALVPEEAQGTDRSHDGEYSIVANGTEIDLDIRGTVLQDSRGHQLGQVRVIRDITTLTAQRRELASANARLHDQVNTIEALRADLATLAVRDELTGLFNRRHLWTAMAEAMEAARACGGAMSVVLLDIDHFKHVNDTFGHGVGDELLTAIAAELTADTREGDVVARYGGEEFVVLLPGLGQDEAYARADELRARCQRLAVAANSAHQVSVTVSAGVAGFPVCGDDIAELMQAVDLALYRAKNEGRNRVVVASRRADVIPEQPFAYSRPD